MNKTQFNKLQVGDRVHYSHGGLGKRTIINIETWPLYDENGKMIANRTTAITVEGGNRMKEGDFRDLPRLKKV